MGLRTCGALGVLVIFLVSARTVDAQPQSAVWNGLLRSASEEWTREQADIDLMFETTTELMASSSTFHQLVNALKSSSNLMLFVRPITSREHLGRGRFYLSHDWTIGFLEINVNRIEPRLRIRAIAHELAHAFEIACRCSRPALASKESRETPFARAVEEAVLREHLQASRTQAPGKLAALAATHGLYPVLFLVAASPAP